MSTDEQQKLAERLPNETFDQYLIRLSKSPRIGDGCVKIPAGSLGAILVTSLPRFTEEQERLFASEIDNLTNETQLPDSKTDSSSGPTKS